MKAVHRMSVGAILWLALALAIPSTLAQNTFDDSAMRRDTATRIRQTHGISLNWQQKSLLELMDSEARLSAVKRIKEEHGVQFDWQKTPLLTLMDAEARMNAAKRISQATKKPVDWKKYTLLQLMETEAVELHSLPSATPKKINLGPISNIEIKIPPTIEEQSAIATVLSDMDAEITTLEQRRKKTRDIKQAMMQELLTGKTRLL